MLTTTACKNAKPRDKDYKLADSGGLYLLVKKNGSKLWRQKYYFLRKERLMSHGAYPLMSLADARVARDDLKKKVAQGEDPAVSKRRALNAAMGSAEQTFQVVAMEWFKHTKDAWSDDYAINMLTRLTTDIFPTIGSTPISDVKPADILMMIRKIEARGANEMAVRACRTCSQVFRYAAATGRAESDPTHLLKGAFKRYEKKNFACIDIAEIPDFLKALDRNKPNLFGQTVRATKLLMLTFVRTTELIEAPWTEFDLENRMWVIPGERMKMRKDHIVPLSTQAVSLLHEQRIFTGDTKWVFPNQVRPHKPMTNNTILFAIGRLGYKGTMTGHGFRSLAMSAIKEVLGYRHEVVDRQLAHTPKGVNKAYDRAMFLPERKKMMQDWADYLDSLRK